MISINRLRWANFAFRTLARRASTHRDKNVDRQNAFIGPITQNLESRVKEMEKQERDYTQLPRTQTNDHFLHPQNPQKVDLKDVPTEAHPEVDVPKIHKLKLDMRGFAPDDIRITVCDNLCTVRATRKGTAVDGSKSRQQFEYFYKLPDGVMCESTRAFFDSDCELVIEAPFEGTDYHQTPMWSDRSATEIEVQCGVCDYEFQIDGDVLSEQFHRFPMNDPNLPHEQKVPTPGDDDFPRDIPEDEHKNF